MKRIFLPIEIKVREFHSKLLFSLFAAERGYETIMGGQIELIERMPKLSKGIYIDKSTAITKREWFRTCRALGNHVAAWDEEGLVYLSDEVYHVTRMDPESFGMTDLFFTWGPSHTRTVVSTYPEAVDRVVPVGNPRMDLLRPQFRGYCDERVEELRRKHGRLLLINTNFALHNFVKGSEAAASIFDPYPLKNKNDLLKGWYDFQKLGYEGFLEAASAMYERFPDHTIVIRPSPAEKIEPWVRHFDGKQRGLVSKEGNVVEWIRAADAVVHFNCTTSIEAFLLDVPSIAYRCAKSDVYETPLSIHCSTEASTLEELLEIIQDILAVPVRKHTRESLHAWKDEVIEDHLSALEGDTCCERILDELEKRQFIERPYTLPSVPLIKRIWRAWLKVIRRPDPADMYFYREKFPGVTVEEARSVAASFARTAKRFDKVRIASAGSNIIRIGPA